MSSLLTNGVHCRLKTCLSYDRYPLCTWNDLSQSVQNMICTRIGQASLPTFVLVTQDIQTTSQSPKWRRLRLSDPKSVSSDSNSTVNVFFDQNAPSASDRPRVLRISASQLEIAIDGQTNLIFRSPSSSVEISIAIPQISDTLQTLETATGIPPNDPDFTTHPWTPFVWRCSLCVAQFTVVENHSLELVAAHLRLHLELRFCLTCSTTLPNSVLAVDAPDAQPHSCIDLIVPNLTTVSPSVVVSRGHLLDNTGSSLDPLDDVFASYEYDCEIRPTKRYCSSCRLEFPDSVRFQQHLKNVHKTYRYLCPDCGISFSTKGNLTTHFRRVHSLSDSISCTVCSKRCSSRFNMKRHMQLFHPSNNVTSRSFCVPQQSNVYSMPICLSNNETSSQCLPDRPHETELKSSASRGYYIYMAPQTPAKDATHISQHSDDISPSRTSRPQGIDESACETGELETQNTIGSSVSADLSLVRSKRLAPIVSVQLTSNGWDEEIRLLQPSSSKRNSEKQDLDITK